MGRLHLGFLLTCLSLVQIAVLGEEPIQPVQEEVGGIEISDPTLYPFFARIFTFNHTCVGTLISPKEILTAAHCFRNEDDKHLFVILGCTDDNLKFILDEKYDGPCEVRNSSGIKLRIHQQFSFESVQNDIAILELLQNVNTTDTIRPFNLENTIGRISTDPNTTSKCFALGWACPEEDYYQDPEYCYAQMRKLDMDILNISLNTNVHRNSSGEQLPESETGGQFTAVSLVHGRRLCKGDSGGPLICSDVGNPEPTILMGIVSAGDEECSGSPVVFTLVQAYSTWVTSEEEIEGNGNGVGSMTIVLYVCLGVVLILVALLVAYLLAKRFSISNCCRRNRPRVIASTEMQHFL